MILGHCMYVAVLSGAVHGQNQIKSITFTKTKLIRGVGKREKNRAGEATKMNTLVS